MRGYILEDLRSVSVKVCQSTGRERIKQELYGAG